MRERLVDGWIVGRNVVPLRTRACSSTGSLYNGAFYNGDLLVIRWHDGGLYDGCFYD